MNNVDVRQSLINILRRIVFIVVCSLRSNDGYHISSGIVVVPEIPVWGIDLCLLKKSLVKGRKLDSRPLLYNVWSREDKVSHDRRAETSESGICKSMENPEMLTQAQHTPLWT